MSSEKFSLKWNDFQTNVSKSFSELRKDEDFFDVTLIGEDESKLSAHKVVLASCSSFFKSVLRATNTSNPIIYLSGINSQNLGFMLDYMYQGEVQIFQENIDDFLIVAQKLKIEGLISDQKSEEFSTEREEVFDQTTPTSNHIIVRKERSSNWEVKSLSTEDTTFQDDKHISNSNVTMALNELDNSVEDLIVEENGVMKCKLCGKSSTAATKFNIKSNLRKHVEIHIAGLSFDCHICCKTFRSRESLRVHKYQDKKCKTSS